ncbi:MAG: hypothetical protein AB6733_08155 [Clostridiaceae bacterium]
MDKLFIELRSINKLEDVLTRTERIQPNIQRGDKVPSWDGELIVYKSKDTNKSNILAPIKIQVKGSMQEDLSSKEIKYQVERSDLENYKNDGGCIYYVIYMKDMDNFKIYYNALLPYDLKLILDEMKGEQQSKSLYFEEYPISDIELQMKIYRSFIHNKNKQIGTVNASIKIEELDKEKLEQIDGFNFTLFQSGTDFEDMIETAFELPTYVYANVMDGKLSVPVQKMKFEEIQTNEFPQKVCLNGKCYFDSIKVKKTKNDELLLFGKGFSCSAKEGKLTFNINGTLSERIKDLSFSLELLKNDENYITAGNYYKAKFNKDCLLGNIEDKEKSLTYMKDIDIALKTIGVFDDLKCDNLTELDKAHINILLDNVIHGELLISEIEISKVSTIQIANITFTVISERVGDNTYKLDSLFNKQDLKLITDTNEEISVFLILRRNDFLKISNLNYDVIKNEITKSVYSETIEIWVTQFILEALIAYDKNNNIELYNCILGISKWQVKNAGSDINYLNLFQIIKRQQNLSVKEILHLDKIRYQNENIDVKLGVSILLESKFEIEVYWHQLDEEARNIFKSFPIYHFVKLE